MNKKENMNKKEKRLRNEKQKKKHNNKKLIIVIIFTISTGKYGLCEFLLIELDKWNESATTIRLK